MTSPITDAGPRERQTVLRRGVHLLAEMIRTNPWPFAGALSGALLFASASVAGAIVLGRVTDSLIVDQADSPPTVRAAIVAGAVIIGMSVARAAGVVARRYFGIMATRRMQMEWFDRLSDHYLDQPLRFFHTQPTGKLLAHADNDAERSSFVMQPLPLSLGAIVLLVFASINLAVLDPVLLAIGLALFPTLIVMNRLYTTRVEGPSARAQAHVGEVSAVAHDSFEGALVVKLLGLERRESDRMQQASDRLRKERLVIGRLRAAFEPGLETLPVLGTIALLAVGASRVDSGLITTGDLVQAMMLFGILAFPMRVVGFLLEELPRSVVSRERIVDVLETDHADDVVTTPDTTARRRLPDGPLPRSVEGVAFAFADAQQVLEEAGVGLEEVSVIGGGARSPLWGCILASVLERPLVYREAGEVGPALGAARLARLCLTGEAPEEVCTAPPISGVAEPDPALADHYAPMLERYRSLYPMLRRSSG